MKTDSESGQAEAAQGADTGDAADEHGILVEETAGVERIELGDVEGASASDVERLEEEQLRLVAEISGLRHAAAARERELEAELKAARETLALREAEIVEQEAQIASLALECSGLRDQLKHPPATGEADAPDIPVPSRDHEDLVARLKERLEERGRALAVAREEITALAHEVSQLRAAAGASAQKADDTPPASETGVGDRIRRLLARAREHDAGGGTATAAPPGSEIPTVVMDSEPQAAADTGIVVVELPLPSPVAVEALRRGALRPHPSRVPPVRQASLRRYLISLDPEDPVIHELTQPRAAVGRGAEADLHLNDVTVSRLHAIVLLEGGATIVEDASSMNGVFVNARRVRRAALKDGDTVAFGTARYQYRVGPASGQ